MDIYACQQRFFHPRLMDVVLAQGAMVYSGLATAIPADIALREDDKKQEAQYVRACGYMSSDDEDEYGRGDSMAQWNRDIGVAPGAMVKGARRIRKESKRGRREFSRDLKVSAGEKWRLIVAFRHPLF